MQELITIHTSSIDNQLLDTVDARELHTFLGVGRDFSNWIKGRIIDFGFVEGQDYSIITGSPILASKKNDPRGGHNRLDYHLTLDMAKELSMLERNEMGQLARRYFIQCEKKYAKARGVVAELLKAKPLWGKIKRYKDMGLMHSEISLLCRMEKSTIRKHVRRMEALGLIDPPNNLPQLQGMASHFVGYEAGAV